jgi:hypothetical protein
MFKGSDDFPYVHVGKGVYEVKVMPHTSLLHSSARTSAAASRQNQVRTQMIQHLAAKLQFFSDMQGADGTKLIIFVSFHDGQAPPKL